MSKQVRSLIFRMATGNPTWERRTHGELLKTGVPSIGNHLRNCPQGFLARMPASTAGGRLFVRLTNVARSHNCSSESNNGP